MLVRNGRTLFQNPGKSSGVLSNQSGNVVKGGWCNRYTGGFSQIFGAYTSGNLPPSSFVLPMKNGAMSSRSTTNLAISVLSAALTPALPMVASSSMVMSSLSATLDPIVLMIAAGSMAMVTSVADLSSAASMGAAGNGAISVLSAQLGGLFNLSASGSMVLTPSVVMSALAFMTAEAGGPTPLSPEGLASAVWSESLGLYTTAGTAGNIVKKIKTNTDLIPAAL